MSRYYHEFTIGFNWYYLVAPVMLVLVGLVGASRFKLGTDLKIRSRFNERLTIITSVLAGVALAWMLYSESIAGIIQWFDNCLTSRDSGVYSLFLAGCAVMVVSMFYGVLAFYIARIASNVRRNVLIQKRSRIKMVQAQRMERLRRIREENANV